MALRYEGDDGEMCRLTALTLEDCLDISSNMVNLFVERVPLEARADRSVSLEVQDSAEVQADENHCQPSCRWIRGIERSRWRRPQTSAPRAVNLRLAMAGRLDRIGVLRYTHIPTPLEHSTSPLDDITDATRCTHELALCDRCHTAWGIGSTRVGPGRTPTVHTCSLRGGGRGWLIHETTIHNIFQFFIFSYFLYFFIFIIFSFFFPSPPLPPISPIPLPSPPLLVFQHNIPPCCTICCGGSSRV